MKVAGACRPNLGGTADLQGPAHDDPAFFHLDIPRVSSAVKGLASSQASRLT